MEFATFFLNFISIQFIYFFVKQKCDDTCETGIPPFEQGVYETIWTKKNVHIINYYYYMNETKIKNKKNKNNVAAIQIIQAAIIPCQWNFHFRHFVQFDNASIEQKNYTSTNHIIYQILRWPDFEKIKEGNCKKGHLLAIGVILFR